MPLKELKKLIALCRSQGVLSIKIDGVELHLGALPVAKAPSKPVELPNFDPGHIPRFEYEQPAHIPTDMPEGDALLFYSAPEQSEAN